MIKAIIFDMYETLITLHQSPLYFGTQMDIDADISAPLNAKRAGFNPPCVSLGKCVDCVSVERVCNSISIIEGQSDSNRVKLFIVNSECGF